MHWLFGEMARRPANDHSNEDDAIDGSSLTPEELNSVTDEDLEKFADKLIQKNRYLLKTNKGSDLERSVDESACDFLVRVFRHYATEQKTQWERMTKSVSNSLFTSTTLEAMQRNLGISNQLQDTIEKYTRSLSVASPSHAESKLDVLSYPMPALHMEKNPIHETNEKLESVAQQIEDLRPIAAQTAQLIQSMNDTALHMQADYVANAEAAGQQTTFAIRIAALSLFVSAVGLVISSFFSCQSHLDTKESNKSSDAQIKAFQNEIRDLVAAQREERTAIVKTIVDTRNVSAAAVKK